MLNMFFFTMTININDIKLQVRPKGSERNQLPKFESEVFSGSAIPSCLFVTFRFRFADVSQENINFF